MRVTLNPTRLWLLAFYLAAAMPGCAQVYRVARPAAISPQPDLIILGTLTISASPSAVNFSLVSRGVAAASQGITITTTWSVTGLGTFSTQLYGYFSAATSALSNGASTPDFIPTSAVLGQMTTGMPTGFTPFTQTDPSGFGGAGAGLELYSATNSIGILGTNGGRTDVLNLGINLNGVPQLPAGNYTGTLTLQATMM